MSVPPPPVVNDMSLKSILLQSLTQIIFKIFFKTFVLNLNEKGSVKRATKQSAALELRLHKLYIDYKKKKTWKTSRKMANKIAQNDAFLTFIEGCITNVVHPQLCKLSKQIPTNFCHGNPPTPESEFKKDWDLALKDASSLILARVKGMAEKKKRSLNLRLTAQDQVLVGLINNQQLSDKVIGIRNTLAEQHSEAMTKRSDARLARLIKTGDDTAPSTPQNSTPSGNSQNGASTSNSGASGNNQGFQRQGPKGTQRRTNGPPRPPNPKGPKRPRFNTQYSQGPPQFQGPPQAPPMNPWYSMPPWPPMWFPPPPMGPPTQMGPPQSPRMQSPRGPPRGTPRGGGGAKRRAPPQARR